MRIPTRVRALLGLLLLAAGPVSAAETARYRVTFDATWSVGSHPTDFPPNPHFSSPIGATHSSLSSFWQIGQLASPGIQNMAELGSGSPLTSEMSIGGARTIFALPGISTSPGQVEALFDVFDSDPLVTLVSMIAPSPDWFVGVSGVALHTGTAWVDPLVIPLSPYDAGTDSGVTFLSPDLATTPPVPIAGIAGFPFTGTPPLGTFTFELVRVLATCENQLDDDGDGLVDGDDPGCSGPSDTSEQDGAIACDDGVDNDGDELIDWPDDTGCLDLFDPTEEPIEAAPALSPLATAGLAGLLALAAATARRASRRG
jgi:hypothetical protein